jgi:drug/metabolite transporter (DMT)-like permease
LALRQPVLLQISLNDIPYFSILGIFGMAGVQFFYLFAISKINVAVATLLEYIAPVFIALYMVFFAKEKLNTYVFVAIIGAVIGCYLVVGAYNLDILTLNRAGILGGLAAAVSFSWFSVHGEYGMRRYNPRTVLFYAFLFASVVWNILYPPLKAFTQPYSLKSWFWILYIGSMGTVLPFGFYYEGISRIRSTRASITVTLEPFIAGLVSYLFLNEIMSPLQMMGGVLVIASIVQLQLKQRIDSNAPDMVRSTKNS